MQGSAHLHASCDESTIFTLMVEFEAAIVSSEWAAQEALREEGENKLLYPPESASSMIRRPKTPPSVCGITKTLEKNLGKVPKSPKLESEPHEKRPGLVKHAWLDCEGNSDSKMSFIPAGAFPKFSTCGGVSQK